MIIEARCNDCGKRIGYASVLGDTEMLRDTKYVRKITHICTTLVILCDECKEWHVDLEGEQK